MAARFNRTVLLGEDLILEVTCDIAVTSLAGATIEWRLASDGELKAKLTNVADGGILVIDPVTKVFRVEFNNERQLDADLVSGLYWHEAYVFRPGDGGSIQVNGTIDFQGSLKRSLP